MSVLDYVKQQAAEHEKEMNDLEDELERALTLFIRERMAKHATIEQARQWKAEADKWRDLAEYRGETQSMVLGVLGAIPREDDK